MKRQYEKPMFYTETLALDMPIAAGDCTNQEQTKMLVESGFFAGDGCRHDWSTIFPDTDDDGCYFTMMGFFTS